MTDNTTKLWHDVIAKPKQALPTLFEPLITTDTAKILVDFLCEHIVSASIEEKDFDTLPTEHSEYENDEESFSAKALCLLFEYNGNETSLVLGHPSINKTPPNRNFPYEHFGFLKSGWVDDTDTTLFGDFDQSRWTSDDYKFESCTEEEYDTIAPYDTCLIEINEYQWLLQNPSDNSLAFVSSITTWDRHLNRTDTGIVKIADYVVEQLPDRPISEYFLKLTVAYLSKIHLSLALMDERIFSLVLPEIPQNGFNAKHIYENDLHKLDVSYKKLDAPVKLHLTGENDYTWSINLAKGSDWIQARTDDTIETTITMKEKDFLKLWAGMLEGARKVHNLATIENGDPLLRLMALQIFD